MIKLFVITGLLLSFSMAPAPMPLWALGTAPREPSPVADTAQTRLLLVVPTRYTIVQLAFDVQQLRHTELLAYDDQSPADTPIIHVWNPQRHDWILIDVAQLRSGTLFPEAIDTAVVVGRDEDLPQGLLAAVGAQTNYRRVPELNLANTLNTLHEELTFTAREWKWLANRYGIKLQDLNAERRRYGRFGKPDASGRAEDAPVRQRQQDIEPLPPRTETTPPTTAIPDDPKPPVAREVQPDPEPAPPKAQVKTPTAAPDPAPTVIPDDTDKDIAPEDK